VWPWHWSEWVLGSARLDVGWPVESSPGRCYAPEQDSRRELQGICQLHERREARITKSALDPRDLGHVVELLFSRLGVDQLAYADPLRLEGLVVRCRHAGASLVVRVTFSERVHRLVERDRVAGRNLKRPRNAVG
jgi:hypothetical protein